MSVYIGTLACYDYLGRKLDILHSSNLNEIGGVLHKKIIVIMIICLSG